MLYLLTRIDVRNAEPCADVFDNERHAVLIQDNDILKQLKIAMGGFAEENPMIRTYKEWGQAGGFDFRIYSAGVELFRASSILSSPRLRNALLLAMKYHGDQKRKIDGHPYLEHPLIVGHVLWKKGFSPPTVAAGFCHDLLEDTACTEEEIRRACGAETLRIVRSVSQDGSIKDWDKKKEAYIAAVEKGGKEAMAVSLVDKIHNAESLLAAFRSAGPSVWNKFNRGKKDKIKFEKHVHAMATKHGFPFFLDEYRRLIEKLEQLADS